MKEMNFRERSIAIDAKLSVTASVLAGVIASCQFSEVPDLAPLQNELTEVYNKLVTLRLDLRYKVGLPT